MIRFVPNKLKVALINKNKSCHLTILKVEIHIKGTNFPKYYAIKYLLIKALQKKISEFI